MAAGVWRVSDQDGRRTGLMISEALARAGDLTASETEIVSDLLVRYETAFLNSFQVHYGAPNDTQNATSRHPSRRG